jgi:hypothetical protein
MIYREFTIPLMTFVLDRVPGSILGVVGGKKAYGVRSRLGAYNMNGAYIDDKFDFLKKLKIDRTRRFSTSWQ